MYQPYQQQPSGYPPQQQQQQPPQQMSPPGYPAMAQPYQAQPYQAQPVQPFQAQPVQPYQAQQAPGPIAPDRESYQSVLPPSVTPGWNDPPAVLPTGHQPNRLTAMRRRPVDPSISGSGIAPMGYGAAPAAAHQPQGQPGQYGYGQQPQQQQQQGYQSYGQQYQQGAPYQQQQY